MKNTTSANETSSSVSTMNQTKTSSTRISINAHAPRWIAFNHRCVSLISVALSSRETQRETTMTRGFSVQNPLFGIVWFRRHPLRWLIIVLHRCLLVYPSINNSRVSKQFTAPWLPSKYSTYLFVGKYAFCKWLIDPRAISTRDIDSQFSYSRVFRRHLLLLFPFPFLSFPSYRLLTFETTDFLFPYSLTFISFLLLFSLPSFFASLISNLTSNVKKYACMYSVRSLSLTFEHSLKQNKVFKIGSNDSNCLEKLRESDYQTTREKDFGKVFLLEPAFLSVVYGLKISSDKKIAKTFMIVRVCSQFVPNSSAGQSAN